MTEECIHLIAEATGICLHCGKKFKLPVKSIGKHAMTPEMEAVLAKSMSELNMETIEPEEHAKKHVLTPEMEAMKWQPGESGNPGGVPKGKSITAELRKLIDKGTNAEDMAEILYTLARKGSRAQMEAYKTLLDRTEGRVPETHKIESDIPISIVFKEIERREDGQERADEG